MQCSFWLSHPDSSDCFLTASGRQETSLLSYFLLLLRILPLLLPWTAPLLAAKSHKRTRHRPIPTRRGIATLTHSSSLLSRSSSSCSSGLPPLSASFSMEVKVQERGALFRVNQSSLAPLNGNVHPLCTISTPEQHLQHYSSRIMCDETIVEYLQRTYDPNPLKRKQALKDLCPCHVRADIPELWDRIFELLSDKEGIVGQSFSTLSVLTHQDSYRKPWTLWIRDTLEPFVGRLKCINCAL